MSRSFLFTSLFSLAVHVFKVFPYYLLLIIEDASNVFIWFVQIINNTYKFILHGCRCYCYLCVYYERITNLWTFIPGKLAFLTLHRGHKNRRFNLGKLLH